MIRNYLKIAFRNLYRNKLFSLINIAGLATGMAVCLLIVLWVSDELSYDNFHRDGERIYRVIQEADYAGEWTTLARTPFPLGKALQEDYPAIEQTARIMRTSAAFRLEDKTFSQDPGIYSTPNLLTFFSFPLIAGNPRTALAHPLSVVLTEKTARKYFGTTQALGKSLEIEKGFVVEVTGIMRDVPANSHLQFDFIVPFDLIREYGFNMDEMPWENSNNAHYTYLKLRPGADAAVVSDQIAGVMQKHVPESTNRFFLQPLSRIHLYSGFVGDVEGHGDIKYVYIFSLMAVFVLLIACFNFMNLTTARSGKRAREVGIRKVVGASRSELVRQFFGESILFSLLAMVLAHAIVELFLPVFNHLAQKQLEVSYFSGNLFLPVLIGLAVLTGIVAGSYPALFLSSFQPATVLKGAKSAGAGSARFRKILVVTQFSISIILIISTLIVYNQLNFMRSKKLGFDKDKLLYVHLTAEAREKYDALKSELQKNPGIENITVASHLLTDVSHTFNGVSWEGKLPGKEVAMNGISVDHDFIRTFGMKMAEGRDFSREFTTDSREAYILNEAAVQKMGIDSPVGKQFSPAEGMDRSGKIIGVVQNFHFKPLNRHIEPMFLMIGERERYYMYLRMKKGNLSGSIAEVKAVWQKMIPEAEFNYGFFDEALAALYGNEQRIGNLFRYFAFLAIFISCLGLFGLASFMAEQRTKEIGIRKVLGAGISNIVLLMSGQFLKWVLLANLLAWPLAWLAMHRWLQNFAYRTEVEIRFFLLAAAAALVIAFLTVSYQAVRTALANPVNALRYE
ncbi:MAG: ABC transporter permease [Calditrichia bacterium]